MPPTVQDGALSIRLPPTYNPKGPPDQMKDMLPNNIQPGACEISQCIYHVTTLLYRVKEVLVPSKTLAPTKLH